MLKPGTAIAMSKVGKRYTKYDDTPMLLTSALHFRPRTRRGRLWALRGVDLEVYEGESFGVIGRNGSGKSTALGLMAGITAPTEGSVAVRGRVAPLIQVGVGFHKELTGRENIYVNGTILGLSRREIDRKLDDIIAFAEIDDFLDTPVKFYSSGMYVRLGFAVAIHVEPDILLIDEVLAVGDYAFQMKCHERMGLVRQSGTTVVVVSHNLGVIRKMCERVLLLDKGSPKFLGAPADAIAKFHETMEQSEEPDVDMTTGKPLERGVLAIQSLEVIGPDGQGTGHLEAGSDARITVVARVLKPMDDLVVGIAIFSQNGTCVYTDSSLGKPLGPVLAGELFRCTVALKATLPTGSYTVVSSIWRPDMKARLAESRHVTFFVNGRSTVGGVSDLGGSFSLDPCSEPSGPADPEAL